MADSSSVSDSSVGPMVWIQGSRNVVSSIYSPDGSIQVDSTDPSRIGLRVAGASPVSMAVVKSVSGTYASMVITCANLNYNGYTGWKLADAHEVIYACSKGLIACPYNLYFDTADIYREFGSGRIFRVVRVYNSTTGYLIDWGDRTNVNTSRTFVCVR